MTTHQEISALITAYVDEASRGALKVLRDEQPLVATHIEAILEAEAAHRPREAMSPSERAHQEQRFAEIFRALEKEPKTLLAVMQTYGKLNDLRRAVKKEAYHKAVSSLQNVIPQNADQFSFTFQTFAEQGVDAVHVQRYLDELRARFSITPHPTNGTSLEHTRVAIRLENAIADPACTAAELERRYSAYLSNDLVGPKKTVGEEVEEGLSVLDNLYTANLHVKRTLEAVLEESGYARKGVTVRSPILEVEGWYAGDGDGNPNATPEALISAFIRLKDRIKAFYAADINAMIRLEPEAGCALARLLTQLDEAVGEDGARRLRQSMADIARAYPTLAHKAAELDFQIATFGLYFSRVDLRHDSTSLVQTLSELMEAAGLDLADDETGKVRQLSQWLGDVQIIDRLARTVDQVIAADGASLDALRIFNRLKAVAKRPHMSAKLIIAEARGAGDALTALLLLAATGHTVGQPGARMHIVPLAESLRDLGELEGAVRQLLAAPAYRAHAEALGSQIVMVAESDNRRRDGFSAGEKINETIGRLIKLSEDAGLPISVMNGGGASQMRGAQKRATEIGFAQAYEAKKWNAHNLFQPLFTVQGHQGRLLFSPLCVAAYMVEGILSQNIYAKAGMEAQIEQATMTPAKKRRQDIARHDEQLFHKVAREAFHELTADPSIDYLLERAPWVSVIAGNASSRPSKRGGSDQLEGTPARDFIYQPDGAPKRLLDQRAITGDNLARSFGILPLPFLGQREGFAAMFSQGRARTSHLGTHEDAATNTFDNSKPFRDHARSLAITLGLTNFEKAWKIVDGQRPPDAEVEALAEDYAARPGGVKEPVATLAFLEVYASDTAKMLYNAISGRLPVAEKSFYSPHAVLRAFWPELAWHIERRQRQLGFANYVEAELTRAFNGNLDKPVDAVTYRLAQATQASVALNNTPIGMIATFTAKDRINEATWGEAAAREEIMRALTPSRAVAELARDQVLPGAEPVPGEDRLAG